MLSDTLTTVVEGLQPQTTALSNPCQAGLSAPEKRDDRADWQGVAEGLVAPQDGKGTVLGRRIDDDQCLGAVVGVPEGHALDPGDAGGRRNPPCAWPYEPAGVGQCVILHVARDGPGARGDRHYP